MWLCVAVGGPTAFWLSKRSPAVCATRMEGERKTTKRRKTKNKTRPARSAAPKLPLYLNIYLLWLVSLFAIDPCCACTHFARIRSEPLPTGKKKNDSLLPSAAPIAITNHPERKHRGKYGILQNGYCIIFPAQDQLAKISRRNPLFNCRKNTERVIKRREDS